MPERPKSVRTLYCRRLLHDKVKAYQDFHDNISPELEALYREHGIICVSSFLGGDNLFVMVEHDPEVYPNTARILDAHPMEKAWQAAMAEIDDSSFAPVTCHEVYRMGC